MQQTHRSLVSNKNMISDLFTFTKIGCLCFVQKAIRQVSRLIMYLVVFAKSKTKDNASMYQYWIFRKKKNIAITGCHQNSILCCFCSPVGLSCAIPLVQCNISHPYQLQNSEGKNQLSNLPKFQRNMEFLVRLNKFN